MTIYGNLIDSFEHKNYAINFKARMSCDYTVEYGDGYNSPYKEYSYDDFQLEDYDEYSVFDMDACEELSDEEIKQNKAEIENAIKSYALLADLDKVNWEY